MALGDSHALALTRRSIRQMAEIPRQIDGARAAVLAARYSSARRAMRAMERELQRRLKRTPWVMTPPSLEGKRRHASILTTYLAPVGDGIGLHACVVTGTGEVRLGPTPVRMTEHAFQRLFQALGEDDPRRIGNLAYVLIDAMIDRAFDPGLVDRIGQSLVIVSRDHSQARCSVDAAPDTRAGAALTLRTLILGEVLSPTNERRSRRILTELLGEAA